MAAARAVFALLCAGAPLAAWADVPESIPRLALDVANPRRTGRHIVHFEDLVGPRADPRRAGGAKALLVVALAPTTRQGAAAELAAVAEAAHAVAAAGGVLIAVVLSGPIPADDTPLAAEELGFTVVRDPYGIGRRRLGLVGAGQAVVFRSDGRTAGAFGPEPGALERAQRATLTLLDEER